MAETLFPERTRCKTCRKGLGLRATDEVWFGLYCSHKCAGRAAPAKSPRDAPRECTSPQNGVPTFKRRYRSMDAVPSRILEDVTASIYACDHCGHLHVGHSRIDTTKETQIVVRGDEAAQRAEIARFLTARRGQASIKQVAAALKVPQVRIKELEDPKGPVDFTILLRLLNLYKTNLGLVVRQSR